MLPELPDPEEYVEVDKAAELLHMSAIELRRLLSRQKWPELRAVKLTRKGKWLIPLSGIAERFARVERETYGPVRPLPSRKQREREGGSGGGAARVGELVDLAREAMRLAKDAEALEGGE